MSDQMETSKKRQDESFGEPEGKGKLQKLTGSYSNTEPSSSSSVEFRLLCPASKISAINGEDGSFISQILQETGAIVRIEEPVPGCDERVLNIGLDNENDDVEKEANVDEEHDEGEEQNKESNRDEDSKPKNDRSSLQAALLLVLDRMIDGEKDSDEKSEEVKNVSTFVLRVLVPSPQVGCILGKGGCVIKKMASESGAQIRILPRDKHPSCVSASHEVIQITGEGDAVRKALQFVSVQILENHSRPLDFTSANSQSQSHSKTEAVNLSFGKGGPRGRKKPTLEILTFRLLCKADKLGAIIGKGGQVIKTIQQDTGCDVKILEGAPDAEERVVVISGQVHPNDRISTVQDAVLRVQTRIARAMTDGKGVTARILVSSNQIGCLLGKGGNIMGEMRKLSGAHIRMLPKDLRSKCASEDEEVFHINGEFEAVQEALVQITTRLQHFFFGDPIPPRNFPPKRAFLDQPPHPSFFGRRELSPPGMFSNFGPPFHPRDDRPPFMHDIPRYNVPMHGSDRRHWGPQGPLEGGGPGFPDFQGGPRRTPGFGEDNPPAETTTVEVVVPSSVVPEIYGEDGECLKQICEICETKITITEPEPGAEETAIVISGTHEQTHAAQSLIQAFVISETESA